MMLKECRCCHIVKPLSEFSTKRAAKDGKDCYCKQCNREKAAKYRQEHPERVKEIALKTRIKNRERLRQRNKEFYERTKNDPAHIQARKKSIERNKAKWHQADKERRRLFNERWKHPCEKCGEKRLYLIQFHHIDPNTKEFCIGANSTSKSEEVLVNEIKKCVCLCSNCHDEFHYLYGSKPKEPTKALHEYLKESEDKQNESI